MPDLSSVSQIGMWEPRFYAGSRPKNKATNITVTAGDICNIDTATGPDSYRTAPLSGIGPFVWCEKTVLAAQAKPRFSAIDYPCEVYVTFDAICEVGAYVMTSATTPGRVIPWTGNTATNRVCGVFLRKQGHGDESQALTAMGAGQIGIIWFLPTTSPVVGA
jgi:hypothetical protein